MLGVIGKLRPVAGVEAIFLEFWHCLSQVPERLVRNQPVDYAYSLVVVAVVVAVAATGGHCLWNLPRL